MQKNITIGLTIFAPKGGIGFWSNGAHQNICFLWMLLRRCPGVERVYVINGGDGPAPDPATLPPELREIEFVAMGDVVDKLDLLVQAGAQVEAAHVERVHARGGKAIAYKFGNDLAIDAERAIHGKPPGGIFNGARFDEIWTTPQHADTCGSYWETMYRCPVRVLPHIWDPCFVDAMVARFPPGLPRGYQPGRKKKRIAILEPNINLIKTCHVPMLIAERAWRARPDLIDRVLVTNAIHLRDHLSFATFAKGLDLAHALADDGAPVISFEPRYAAPWFLSAHADILISHQWIATPNYAHYDALHLGFPLVHNAVGVGMPGYTYHGFDAIEGGRALTAALTHHDDEHERYSRAAAEFLATRRVTSQENIDVHAWAMRRIYS